MANINVNKDRSTQLDVSTSNTTVTVAKGVTIDSQTNGISETGAVGGNDYVINGSVTSHGFSHSALSFSGTGTKVTIDENGKLKSDYWAVRAFGDNSTVVNEGRITSDEVGVAFAGDNSRLINKGAILVETGAAIDTDNLLAFRLDNSGMIVSESGLGFRVEDLTLNFGKDSVVEFGAFGSIDTSLSNTGWTATIKNAGEITNTGNGMIDAISGGAGSEIIRNTGTITGFVNLDDGDDRYDGRGGRVLEGTILGGGGNDVYILDSSKDRVHDSVGWGYDKLTVSASYSLGINNEIEETRLGGSGDFKLKGNALQNYLEGNKGDNRLIGYAGKDGFFGGEGDDVLTGGADADGFYFRPNADREIVTDFTDGEDLLIFFAGDEIESIADLIADHAHQKGDDLVISGDGTEMILRDFDKANLTAADFTA